MFIKLSILLHSIMITERQRIPKLVLTTDSIEDEHGWRLDLNKTTNQCSTCSGLLFYVKPVYGIVAETHNYGIMHHKENRCFYFREIGFSTFCAECGQFSENYSSFQYNKDEIILQFDELEDIPDIEVQFCLDQFNQKHNFTAPYNSSIFDKIKSSLLEYIKNHPIKKKK